MARAERKAVLRKVGGGDESDDMPSFSEIIVNPSAVLAETLQQLVRATTQAIGLAVERFRRQIEVRGIRRVVDDLAEQLDLSRHQAFAFVDALNAIDVVDGSLEDTIRYICERRSHQRSLGMPVSPVGTGSSPLRAVGDVIRRLRGGASRRRPSKQPAKHQGFVHQRGRKKLVGEASPAQEGE